MAFKKENKDKIILLVFPAQDYSRHLMNFLKKIKPRRCCYVTTNKGCDALLDYLKKKKIKTEGFFFIDCVTETVIEPKGTENCIFISSPKALTELSVAINKFINMSFPLILVDSLSTFSVYHKSEVLTRFFHDLINKARAKKGVSLILVASDKDKEASFFKEIELLSDKVINRD